MGLQSSSFLDFSLQYGLSGVYHDNRYLQIKERKSAFGKSSAALESGQSFAGDFSPIGHFLRYYLGGATPGSNGPSGLSICQSTAPITPGKYIRKNNYFFCNVSPKWVILQRRPRKTRKAKTRQNEERTKKNRIIEPQSFQSKSTFQTDHSVWKSIKTMHYLIFRAKKAKIAKLVLLVMHVVRWNFLMWFSNTELIKSCLLIVACCYYFYLWKFSGFSVLFYFIIIMFTGLRDYTSLLLPQYGDSRQY